MDTKHVTNTTHLSHGLSVLSTIALLDILYTPLTRHAFQVQVAWLYWRLTASDSAV